MGGRREDPGRESDPENGFLGDSGSSERVPGRSWQRFFRRGDDRREIFEGRSWQRELWERGDGGLGGVAEDPGGEGS